MSGAVCPACGVAVVPGYVRCPKCHKPLPRRKSTIAEGGTALDRPGRFPLIAVIAAALLGGGLIVFFGTRGGDQPAVTKQVEPDEEEKIVEPTVVEPIRPEVEAPATPTAPNAESVADELKKTLTKAKLWSTVTVVGEHVDVRSGSCEEPGMGPLLDGAAPSFKAAGLTKLRCLEQSGAVVSERDF